MPAKVLGVIPARLASTRFPGKALVSLQGKPIIQHVWERASICPLLDDLVIATDDAQIYQTARSFRAAVEMTRPDHLSGSDRCAEVASRHPHPIVVNIQGDEPLIDPAAISAAVESLLHHDDALMGTLKKKITQIDEITNPNVVKVVTNREGYAIYFSRSPIPYNRGGSVTYFKHIGLYTYRREFLLNYAGLPVGPLEEAEKLEQLRALENGYAIHVAETSYESLGVDTPEDLRQVEKHIASGRQAAGGQNRT